ncbi:ABC transporter ATP-binding protein [bacterium]|nr:ABC transporter ATP-binding protein [bacterium]
MLRLDSVHAGYGQIEVLRGVQLNVERGEIVTLIGANGAGKSTTLLAVSGIVHVRSGTISFEGKSLAGLRSHEVTSLGIAHVPEGRRIFKSLTVLENLRMGAFQRHDNPGIAQDIEKVFSLFPVLGERKRQLGGTLSGGEQQMLAIGRAVLARPRLLLLDEPSLGLAPLVTQTIFSVVRELNAKEGTTVLLVEQNARLALDTASRGYVLEIGRVVAEGPSRQLLTDPRVIEAYLGEA